MRCDEYSHAVSVDEIDSNTLRYSGNFDIIRSTDDMVLVKKKYYADCPSCYGDSVVTRERLELVPMENIDFGDGV